MNKQIAKEIVKESLKGINECYAEVLKALGKGFCALLFVVLSPLICVIIFVTTVYDNWPLLFEKNQPNQE